MTDFASVELYLEKLRTGAAPPIIPLQMAADHLGVSRAAIDQMLRGSPSSRRLRPVRIGKQKFVDAQSLIELEDLRSSDKDTVRKFLETKARARQNSVFYEPVMARIGRSPGIPADRSYIGSVLGSISEDTYSEGGVLLSVLVHRKTLGRTRPGLGFFGLAKSLKCTWKDDDKFVETETQRVLDYYRR